MGAPMEVVLTTGPLISPGVPPGSSDGHRRVTRLEHFGRWAILQQTIKIRPKRHAAVNAGAPEREACIARHLQP